MAEFDRTYDYVAIDPAGRRQKGQIPADNDGAAFERLRRDGLSPLSIKVSRAGAKTKIRGEGTDNLSDRALAAFLFELAALLKAGADMRTALGLLGSRSEEARLKSLCRKLNDEISGGGALDQAFAGRLSKSQQFIAALVAAGQAAGDLASGMERAAELLESRIKMRDQLISTLSYPSFVLASTVAAVFVILLFVVPSLAPLVLQSGVKPPLVLGVLIAASNLLRGNLATLAVLLLVGGGALYLAARAGMLDKRVDRFMLDGPMKRTVGGFVFGGFSITLGNMLTAGAPMSDALRLAVRSVRSVTARERLEAVTAAVRQGQSLSNSLSNVRDFPVAISRLVAVGEVSGSLGLMLARAGKLEEGAAVRRLEATVRFAGPALIVGLGGLVGLLMASLLSGVSQIGQTAIQ